MAPTGSGHVPGARPDRLRTHAIERYCREFCGSARMPAAARDAIDSISPADAWGGDDALLRVTRTAAAAHAPTKASPKGWRGMLAAEHESECNLTPSLLAQRANGELSPAGQTRLEEHLGRCLFCSAAELRERRATRAFSAVIATGNPRSRRATAPVPPEPPASEPPVSEPPAPAPPAQITEVRPSPEPAVPARRGLAVFPASPAAAAAEPATAAISPLPRPARRARPATRPGLVSPERLRAYLPFFATLAIGAVLVVVIALVVDGGAQAQNAAASLPPPSPASTPPPSVGLAASKTAPTPRTHTTATHPAATTPTTTSTATSSTTPAAAVQPTAAAPVANQQPSNTPAANPTPTASQPTKPKPTTTSSPPPVVATQQGTGLPAATAPTQTIGRGGGGGGGTSTTH